MMSTATMTKKRRGDFDDDDDGNNGHKDDDNNNARTTLTSFFDTTTNLWSDAFLEGRGLISMAMTTATMLPTNKLLYSEV